MPGFNEIKQTFRPGALANTGGVNSVVGQTLTIEFLDADPTTVAGVPRAWVNVTNNTFKIWDGAQTLTVTVTVT